MTYEVKSKRRGKYFKEIASIIWRKIIAAHNVDMDTNEPGITGDIITSIRTKNRFPARTFEVFARPGWREGEYGADLDLFVETADDKFRWFALQAKVLKRDGTYHSLKYGNAENQQWDKLNLLEAESGCQAFYLLYNGVKDFQHDAEDRCGVPFSEEHYGCSLVKVDFIRSIMDGEVEAISPSKVSFADLHPNFAEPWHILSCSEDFKGLTLYSRGQLVRSNRRMNLQSITHTAESEYTEFITQNSSSNDPISEKSRVAGWKPGVRIIVERK
jgi:hypothetical protein